MPRKTTVERSKKALREGKSPTTAAGEFVREEMEHVRRGKHGARSRKQVVAIGLSKARRAGVPLPPPKKGQAKKRTGPTRKTRSQTRSSRATARTTRPATRRSKPARKTRPAARKAGGTRRKAR